MSLGAFAAFLLLLAVAYLIARPFIAPLIFTPEAERPALLGRKQQILDSIRELDMDLATGKLAEEDHRALRAPLAAEAVIVMRAIEEGAAEPDGRRVDVVEPLQVVSVEEALEREIAERKAALAARACSICGTPRSDADRFCRECGEQLPAVIEE